MTRVGNELKKEAKLEVADSMIKDGDSVEKIKRNTGLSEEQIMELKRLLETKGEH